MNRPSHSTELLRHNFTQNELVDMGAQLAEAHSQLATIKSEKAAAVAQFQVREKELALQVERLSGLYTARFQMRSIRCRLEWDKPNTNEVSTIREDTGEVVRVRAFTPEERQQDLPLTDHEGEVAVVPPAEKTDAEAAAAVESSQVAVDGFFDPNPPIDAEFKPEPEPEPAAAVIDHGAGTEDDLDF